MKFQDRVTVWLHECFGLSIAEDKQERNHRFIEEALELVQSCECTKEEVLILVDYVYDRPAGEKFQEIGGVMNTLAALCTAHRVDMMLAGHREVDRCWMKLESIREKQKTKPKNSPLPQSITQEG